MRKKKIKITGLDKATEALEKSMIEAEEIVSRAIVKAINPVAVSDTTAIFSPPPYISRPAVSYDNLVGSPITPESVLELVETAIKGRYPDKVIIPCTHCGAPGALYHPCRYCGNTVGIKHEPS